MKIMVNLSESFIDVWNEEKEMWERYAKVSLVPEEENKIPEKIDQNNFEWKYIYSKKSNKEIINNLTILRLKYNEIIDYLKSKGE